MKPNGASAASSRDTKEATRRNLLQRFLSHAYEDPRSTNRKWMEMVKRDILTLCETSAIFDLGKQWREHPMMPAPSLRALRRNGHLRVSIESRQVTAWMIELNNALDELYPKELPTPEPFFVNEWSLPAKLFGVKLLIRAGEIRKIEDKTKKVLAKKSFAHIRTCYVVEWPHIFWFAIANLLEEFAKDLRRCVTCRGLFLKAKRQEYCSSTCRIAQWRDKNPDRVYEIRSKAYEREVHKTHPRAVIKRRGRRRPQQS